jgi:hypothetical protein
MLGSPWKEFNLWKKLSPSYASFKLLTYLLFFLFGINHKHHIQNTSNHNGSQIVRLKVIKIHCKWFSELFWKPQGKGWRNRCQLGSDSDWTHRGNCVLVKSKGRFLATALPKAAVGGRRPGLHHLWPSLTAFAPPSIRLNTESIASRLAGFFF